MRQLYFGINEIEGDIFIAISTESRLLNDLFTSDEWDKIDGLMDYEIYESIDSIYQAPSDYYTCDEVTAILEKEGFEHSSILDDLIIKIDD